MHIAHGSRDENGKWHPTNPNDYPPLDIHGQLPWSVLDQNTAHWKKRKKWWTDQGVDDITPRLKAAGMINTGRHGTTSQGVSRFDPYLTELLITWFSAPGWTVYDPCAGGPVRGVVTTALGRHYQGRDINPEQVHANHKVYEQWGSTATITENDGRNPAGDEWADFVLTCPPYHNRERYTDRPEDLSNMKWGDFVEGHKRLVNSAAAALKDDRFLAWIISDVRDHKGHLRGLPAIAAQHIRDAGLHITNELILVAPPGTRAKTMRIPWTAARTTSRRHQIIITAVKGDRKKATQAIREATQ